MSELLDRSARILRGEADIEDHHPFRPTNVLDEVGTGWRWSSFANVPPVATDDGLVLVDTGCVFAAPAVHAGGADAGRPSGPPRRSTPTATSTTSSGPRPSRPRPEAGGRPVEVIAHEDVDPRFDRYCADRRLQRASSTSGSSRRPGLRWPTEYRRPDRTYRDRLDLDVGGVAARAAPRPGRDRRPHLGLGARAAQRAAPAT